ncbi:MAG: DUF4239 domain-containing protein [Actinophytocola sp.]|nr:DUF4239 domain-containing protein [Actinophytocola sp.]
MSTVQTGTYVVLAGAALSAAGFLVISRIVPDRWLIADSEAASALYGAIGMAYAILIAIAAIAVWEVRAGADEASEREASAIVETHRAANGLATSDRTEVQELLAQYTSAVVDDEWPALRNTREEDPGAASTFETLRERVDQLDRTDSEHGAAAEWVSRHTSDMAEARLLRLDAADEPLPEPLWPTLALGGFVSVAFLYLFGLERTFPNGLMMATVGGMIAVVLFVIYEMQYPFSPGLALEPDVFQAALEYLTPGRDRATGR